MARFNEYQLGAVIKISREKNSPYIYIYVCVCVKKVYRLEGGIVHVHSVTYMLYFQYDLKKTHFVNK